MSSPHPDPFGHNPFAINPYGEQPPGPSSPPVYTSAAVGGWGPVNALATVSVVFAFVFAPAGVILGHVGLRQIAISGQRGRTRALVGVTLSYVFIVAAVTGVVVAAILRDTGVRHGTAAITSTPGTTTAPSLPTMVMPTDLARLLPSSDDIKLLTGHTLASNGYSDHPVEPPGDGAFTTPANCLNTMVAGLKGKYDLSAVRGFAVNRYGLDPKIGEAMQSVAAYGDSGAAQGGLQKILADWRTCGGTTFTYTDPTGGPGGTSLVSSVAASTPTSSDNDLTSMIDTGKLPIRDIYMHTVAAKANIVVETEIRGPSGFGSIDQAAAVASFILNKIPGPR